MAKEKDDLNEKLLKDFDFCKLKPEQITGESGLLKQLTKRIVETAMNAEMTNHLGYKKRHRWNSIREFPQREKQQNTTHRYR